MAALAATFATEDVGDPSDWPAGCEVVKALDTSLRCDLCFDIFTAPVSFKTCSHTFCSTCIRTHINQPGSAGAFCPKCRQNKAYDSELYPVTALETTAENWRKMRPFVIQLWKRAEDASKEAEQLRLQRSEGASGRRSGRVRDTGPDSEQSHSGKRKAENDLDDDEHPRRRSTRVRTLRNLAAVSTTGDVGGSADSAFVLSDDDEAGDASYEESRTVTPNGRSSTIEADKEHQDLKSDDRVACPICQHHFTIVALNAHLDKNKCYPGCPPPSVQERGAASKLKTPGIPGSAAWFSKIGASNVNGESSAAPSATAKRLLRTQYSLKTERDLRKLLESLGLPTTGDKEKLTERHRQYVNLYNGNLDAAPANRKSEAKLRKELMEWERARDARRSSALTDKKAASWLADNKAQYSDLIAQARETAMRDRERRNKPPTPPSSSSADVDATAASSDTVDATIQVETIAKGDAADEPNSSSVLAVGVGGGSSESLG